MFSALLSNWTLSEEGGTSHLGQEDGSRTEGLARQSATPEGVDDVRFNSEGSRGQQESGAKRDHHKSRPIRFDFEAATRSFRLQRVRPGAKPLCTTHSASPDWLKRHLEHANENKERTKPYEGHSRLHQ
jgi:hypothetical protein